MIGEAAALAAAACWAVGSHLFGRIGRSGDVPAVAMNLGKCATASLLFGVTVVLSTGRVLPPADAGALGWLVASGVVGLALGDSAYFGAIVTIGVRRALLLLSTAPVLAALGGALVLHEPLSLRDALSVVAVVAGVTIVVQERVRRVEATIGRNEQAASAVGAPECQRPSTPRSVGVLLGLAAGVGQATGSLMSRHAMQSSGVTAKDAAFVRIVAGFVGIVALSTIAGRLGAHVAALRRGRTLPAVAASSVVGTYIGIWLAQFSLGHARSTAVASTLLATSPLFALPLGRWLEGEPLTVRAVSGTLLAFAGLAGLLLGR